MEDAPEARSRYPIRMPAGSGVARSYRLAPPLGLFDPGLVNKTTFHY